MSGWVRAVDGEPQPKDDTLPFKIVVLIGWGIVFSLSVVR